MTHPEQPSLPTPPRFTDAVQQRIRTLYEDGHTPPQIQALTGLARPEVDNRLDQVRGDYQELLRGSDRIVDALAMMVFETQRRYRMFEEALETDRIVAVSKDGTPVYDKPPVEKILPQMRAEHVFLSNLYTRHLSVALKASGEANNAAAAGFAMVFSTEQEEDVLDGALTLSLRRAAMEGGMTGREVDDDE